MELPRFVAVAVLTCAAVAGRAAGGRRTQRSVGEPAPGARRGSAGRVPGCLRGREPLLAVDHEQHEPCGVQAVPASVPDRNIQRAGQLSLEVLRTTATPPYRRGPSPAPDPMQPACAGPPPRQPLAPMCHTRWPSVSLGD